MSYGYSSSSKTLSKSGKYMNRSFISFSGNFIIIVPKVLHEIGTDTFICTVLELQHNIRIPTLEHYSIPLHQ